jgi:hypothetical protein
MMSHMDQVNQESGSPEQEPQEVTAVSPEALQPYNLHVQIPGEMKQKLQDATELAYKLELIEKPSLTNLMNLFTLWGMELLKRKWYERMGYR